MSTGETDSAPAAGRALSPGDRLGPYDILGPLGAGGMGEVYRARDPRLRRDVAVKVLHRSLAVTPEIVQRLTREARAAGSLNHPNIVAVFDVDTEGPRPYIVSELLEGESLRSRLNRGPVPYRKALEYAIQIAEGLGAAHDKGIWHRDVKPANVFVTEDGRVKLLDFGLVKMRAPEKKAEPDDPTADDTRPGAVHGTLGYMSPEQLLGEAVDHRTDIFALGAVFYEMLSGIPAFRRGTTGETTRAVLSEEPLDLLQRNRDLPRAAVAVVERCLEKSKEERFQSARDLAFHLQQLQEMPATRKRDPRLLPRPLVVAAVVLGMAALAAGAALLAPALRRPVPAFAQLTFHRGRIGGARFAAESGGVVYSEAREGRPLEVWWLTGPDSPESRPLGHRGADILAARSGKLALSLGRHFVFGERFVGTLAEAPLGEGAPRELADGVEDADWDPLGRQFVLARSSGAGGESRLEYPPGHTLYKTPGSIRFPRFSRDGKRIAFLEDPTGRGAGGRVALVDLQGHFTALTEDWSSARGLAWSARGDEIWFAAGAFRTNRALRAVDLQRRERLILETPASLTLWDIALDGRTLVARDEERSALVGVPPGETTERDLSWFDTASVSDLSEDGRMLLFADRYGVYIRPTDGSPAIHLGLKDGFGDDFSPDGNWVLATNASGSQLVILPAGLGEAKPLPEHGIATHRGAQWLPDGRHIVFNGALPGGNMRSYLQDIDGGVPQALTPENVWMVSISPDGEWVAAIGPEQGISLWSVRGGKPSRPVSSSQVGDRPVAWTADGRSLWIFRRGEVPAEVWQLEIDTGRRRLRKTLRPSDPSGVYSIHDFRVTRDGGAYFYSYKRVVSQLYSVQGLR
jgi:eukaryotic-like serine/threonine-protein kinase